MASALATLGIQAGMNAMGMPMMPGMPSMPAMPSLTFDSSSRATSGGSAYGGGGMDTSGWVVNVGQPMQAASVAPPAKRVVYTADPFGLPALTTNPMGLGNPAGPAAVAPMLPTWAIYAAGAFVLVKLLK